MPRMPRWSSKKKKKETKFESFFFLKLIIFLFFISISLSYGHFTLSVILSLLGNTDGITDGIMSDCVRFDSTDKNTSIDNISHKCKVSIT